MVDTNIPPAYGGSADAGAAVPGLQQRTKMAAAVLPVCPGGECLVDESDQSMLELSLN